MRCRFRYTVFPSAGSQTWPGTEFQVIGPATENARRPSVLQRYREVSRSTDDDWQNGAADDWQLHATFWQTDGQTMDSYIIALLYNAIYLGLHGQTDSGASHAPVLWSGTKYCKWVNTLQNRYCFSGVCPLVYLCVTVSKKLKKNCCSEIDVTKLGRNVC